MYHTWSIWVSKNTKISVLLVFSGQVKKQLDDFEPQQVVSAWEGRRKSPPGLPFLKLTHAPPESQWLKVEFSLKDVINCYGSKS